MYDSRCDCCGGIASDLADNESQDWETIYNEIAKDILDNKASDINQNLHFKTAKKLMDAVYDGLGDTQLAYDDERAILASYLQRNIYAFSAAKSYTQMLHFRNLMIGEDGKLLGYGSFKKAIADQGAMFNDLYLKTEYNNAYNSVIMAHKWETLQTDYLEYSTVGDDRVRPEHKLLDKFTALKTDPAWRRIYPPLQWNCRCTVVPGKAINSEKTMTGIEASKMIKPYVKDTPFDNNVGISKLIFTDNHPYFQNVKGEIKNLSFEQYGLQSLEKIRVNPLDEYKPTTKEQYLEWWEKQPKKAGNDFVVKDALNQEILLSSGEGKRGKSFDYYKEHILKKEADKRFEYGTETINILKNPDEIWNNYEDKNSRIYIKYYEQGTLKLVVNEKMEAITLYQIGDKFAGELDRSRKGVLLLKK
ncbi:minor capsid protein [Flavobacterium psychrophilum]|uniref:minor capsid protein n=1 Tax=Flavobacterium psychrophilum TaxID=96345 RepID=UPI000B7C2641|nr:minor capsid protein [Flavobacterium psychrophilum]MBF2024360.1 minor capsid protein [Flavobacterium psychrophilum]MCB5983188.1 minor capsid protein [Flavobacterium psychrophilum]MCB5995434.1 minor capsid protein [Flavobacterium psychrophilum]MCB5997772.1 minor capsid protein [Flavobacterium psychrophilum]MCB6005349.1 minor capsid protein [Flavobacterium psychrophilum]